MSSLFPTHHPSFAPFESWRLAITTSDDEKSMSSVAFTDDLIVGSRWRRRGRRETEREQGRQKKLLTRRVHKRDAIGSNSFFFLWPLKKKRDKSWPAARAPCRTRHSILGRTSHIPGTFSSFFFVLLNSYLNLFLGRVCLDKERHFFFFKCAAVAMILLLFHF